MQFPSRLLRYLPVAAALALALNLPLSAPFAQTADDTAQARTDENRPAPLIEDQLEILVARIALYPDDLVALVTSASLFPVEIIDAQRFLVRAGKDKSLKPKEAWDDSIISLLNYPEVVNMMGDDLDWTQALGEAIAYQQTDVLNAIQQLRDEAVAKGIIKTDEKIKVLEQEDNVIIQSASVETVYVPRYEPRMLYEADYVPAPVAYYPEPYPVYYYPTAPYFAGFVTGAFWGATVDWVHHGVWRGRWNGNDIHINCNNCFNNINGKVRWNDVDWRHVDRSKIDFDRNQFNAASRKTFHDAIRANSTRIGNNRSGSRVDNHSHRVRVNDVRAANNSGNKVKINNNVNVNSGNTVKTGDHNKVVDNSRHTNVKHNGDINRVKNNTQSNTRNNIQNRVDRTRPGHFNDDRARQPSALGDIRSGRQTQMHSNRGRDAIGLQHRANFNSSHMRFRRR